MKAEPHKMIEDPDLKPWQIQMLNDCFYCHKIYKANLVNHYCDDCVMICDTCNCLKGIWCFGHDEDSEAVKQWKANGAHGKVVKAGRLKTCDSCRETLNADPIERLRKAASKLKPGQLELLLNSQKRKE